MPEVTTTSTPDVLTLLRAVNTTPTPLRLNENVWDCRPPSASSFTVDWPLILGFGVPRVALVRTNQSGGREEVLAVFEGEAAEVADYLRACAEVIAEAAELVSCRACGSYFRSEGSIECERCEP